MLIDLEPLTGLTERPVLTSLLAQAVKGYGTGAPGHVMEEAAWSDLTAFMRERLAYVLEARGADRRNVRAVLTGPADRPVSDLAANLMALPEFTGSASFRALATAFKRVRNIARELPDAEFTRQEQEGAALDGLLKEPAELALLAELDRRSAVIGQTTVGGNGYREAYLEASKFEPSVAKFFTDVFVMADDLTLRQARLRLMKRLEQLILQLGDISEIVAAE